ncbi:hypothetical protein ACWEPC_12795 [Nonomuraea sp. NPDC004297]
MAPTPAGPWPATSGEVAGDVADCLGGAVHLAYAESAAPPLAAVTAGFAGYEAQTRARALARVSALRHLHGLPEPGRPDSWPGKELRLADFVSDPPESLRLHAGGVGLLSGRRYRVPVEVVWAGERDCRVEPALTGVVDQGVAEAVAELVAHDVVARWWADPREPLLRVSGWLGRLLPDGVLAAASGLGLRVSAFVLSAPEAKVAMVVVGGEGGTLAVAAGRGVKAAVCEAFLRAMAAKAEPWAGLALGECLRRFAVWQREADYATHLERLGVDADPRIIDEVSGLRPSGWPEIAARRFGHEPIAVRATAPGQAPVTGEAVKVVCPGALCYRVTPTLLPCPVG